MKKKKNNLSFIEEYKVYAIGATVAIIFLYALITYTYNMSPIKINPDFGSIGDFIGGILNPIFGFLGLFALLATIRLQNKELRNSSKELKLTRKEAHKSSKALNKQSKSIKLQNFENTFFNMIDLHNEIVRSIDLSGSIRINGKINSHEISSFIHGAFDSNSRASLVSIEKELKFLLYSYNSFPNYEEDSNYKMNLLKNQQNNTNELYLLFYKTYEPYLSHYFRNIYQILKFISNAKDIDKKFYANIFRSQLSEYELRLLFYNVASEMGREKALPLLIKFEFLEHLPYDKDINRKDVKLYIKKAIELGYNANKVFGKSEWNDVSKQWENATKELVQEVVSDINEYNPIECVDISPKDINTCRPEDF